MAGKNDARYLFGLEATVITPLNDDLSLPTPTNLLGGAGPFDYSGATASAVPLITKIDDDVAETVELDFTTPPVADISAVTATEVVAAITAAAPTDLTASVDTNGRVKLAYSGAGDPNVVQVYGLAATTADFGQGKGLKQVYSDTMQSLSEDPILKDSETITTTDANGVDTEVITDSYRKGASGALTDTATDYFLRSIVEGGDYDETNEKYSTPTVNSRTIYFKIEFYSGRYAVGTNKEADLVDYVKETIKSCAGSFGSRTRERGFVSPVYNYSATSYKDPATGLVESDTDEEKISITDYKALKLEEVAA